MKNKIDTVADDFQKLTISDMKKVFAGGDKAIQLWLILWQKRIDDLQDAYRESQLEHPDYVERY